MGGNPGGGGGGGTRASHDFEGGGHNIKCPPPHVFVVNSQSAVPQKSLPIAQGVCIRERAVHT